MLYSSLQNPKIKEVCKLKQKKYRDESGLFLVEGETALIEAFRKKALTEVFVREGTSFSMDVPISFVTDKVMEALSSLDSIPNVIGICRKNRSLEITDRIVILENVQDPGNVGTIIRSAVAFHVGTVFLTKGCADPYSPKVQRAMQGMGFHISITEGDPHTFLSLLKEKGIPIYGTKVNTGKEVFRLYKREKFAIIMGNEGRGISSSIQEYCDDFLWIPMSPLCESLNVGVAASILLYELDKKG